MKKYLCDDNIKIAPVNAGAPVFYALQESFENYELYARDKNGNTEKYIPNSKYIAAIERAQNAESELGRAKNNKLELWHLFIAFFLGIIIGNLLTIAGYAGII